MIKKNIKQFLYLSIWILAIITIGALIGSLTKPESHSWYSTLNRSTLTPPNYVFPIAWTILYGIIGVCGWVIWHKASLPKLSVLKILYIIQLILNWSWPFIFFYYHLIGTALIILCVMDIVIISIIWLAYFKIRILSILMLPYLLWILFASYLNFYIWQYH